MAMNGSTPRQRYLYLVARLYELAAEFSEDELAHMREKFVHEGESLFDEALLVISKLHGAGESVPVAVSTKTKNSTANLSVGGSAAKDNNSRRDRLNPKMLKSLFDDREVFPRLADIAALFPTEMAPQHKEARDRYVQRAVKYIFTCSDEEIDALRNKISNKVPVHRSPFMSQWKSLIKDL